MPYGLLVLLLLWLWSFAGFALFRDVLICYLSQCRCYFCAKSHFVLHGAQCRCADDDNACLCGEINKPSTKTAFKPRCSFYKKKDQDYYDRKRRSHKIFQHQQNILYKAFNMKMRKSAQQKQCCKNLRFLICTLLGL